MNVITQASIAAIGNYFHDIASELINAPFQLKEAKAYELVARYPTLIMHNYTTGKTAYDSAEWIVAARLRSNKQRL